MHTHFPFIPSSPLPYSIMHRIGAPSFSSFLRISSVANSLIHLSRLHIFFLITSQWLPLQCWALSLEAPMPQDTLSMTIFTGGEFSLAWTLDASDPAVFDLVLIGVSEGMTVYPGIQSETSPLKLLFSDAPQNYYFRALDNTTGATLAEGATFEVTAKPTMLAATSDAGVSGSNNAVWATSTDTLTMPTQSHVTLVSTKTPRVQLIGVIIGVILANIVVVVVLFFVWRYRARRARGSSARSLLIEDDALSKDGSSEGPPLLSVAAHVSPFPIPPARPRMSPLRVEGLRPVSDHPASLYRQSPASQRKSSSYYPTSPASTYRPTSSYQPGYGYRTSKYQPLSHHRKLSYDLPSSSSPLSYQSPMSPKDRRASSYLHDRPCEYRPSPRGTLTPAYKRHLELQVELETAVSETVYEKNAEPEMPAKVPTRRHPLRCTSEPRPLSSEYGSADSHELQGNIRHAESENLASQAPGFPTTTQ
ncbi:hypothetical protein B0H11DRAFT_579142 [Mycena galericulata]|nr:hypothetical protein B0H11DRAFT_579142 [Mycena galericulata]